MTNPRNPFYGLLSRRECLVPTWKGLLALTLVGAAITVIAVLMLHPFLAVSEPVPAKVLVVEGWVPDYVLEQAKGEFERNGYSKLYVTGGPLSLGSHLSKYTTYAELGAATLLSMGMSADTMEAVPAPATKRNRTDASAIALKVRLRQQATLEPGINLVSLGPHARRSRLLFQNVLGEDTRVGIVAIENRDYDPGRWWTSSLGVRAVIDELIGYLYAVAVFPLVTTH